MDGVMKISRELELWYPDIARLGTTEELYSAALADDTVTQEMVDAAKLIYGRLWTVRRNIIDCTI